MTIGNIEINEKLVQFGVVGTIGMLLDFGITWFCKEKLRLNKFMANSLGFSVAVVHNYLLNRYWTFAVSASQPMGGQFAKFVLVALMGLALNNLLLYLFVRYTKANFYLLKFVVIGLVFCWNYLANLLFTFH
jgi:putative flippase GtrA